MAEFATITTDDLVTGEGVALDLPPASLGLRLASGLIDFVVTVVVYLVSLFVLLIATSNASRPCSSSRSSRPRSSRSPSTRPFSRR